MNPGVWYHLGAGAGRPLVLLHGIGMSHRAWSAVLPHLSTRRVIAFDIAGFGRTPPLPRGTPPTIANLADALERSLHAIGIRCPVDIAGNSLGGALALEAARRGIARRVVALSPIGLWRTREPAHVKHVFRCLRLGVRLAPQVSKAALRVSWFRELTLAVPVSPGSGGMPVHDAMALIDDLAASIGFEDTFAHTRAPFAGREIESPVMVVFGGRDWLLTRHARWRNGMPAGATWIEKPGWGHVPMWVDPLGVAEVLLNGTA
jgi:pimeloyl-ACP methyl ester carboxylesterase